MMALPYTPGQVTVCCKEETDELAESLDGHAGRPLHAAQPGRARLRRPRRCAGRVRPGRGRRAAGVAVGHRADASRARPDRDRVRRCAVPRRRRAVRDGGGGARLGEGAGLRRRRLRGRPGHRRDRLAARPRRARARRCRQRRPPRSAAVRSWPCASRMPTPASGTAASRTTPRPCSTWRSRSRRAGRRGRRGLGGGVRRAAALPHGPRPRRGSWLLPRRLRGRASPRAAAARC